VQFVSKPGVHSRQVLLSHTKENRNRVMKTILTKSQGSVQEESHSISTEFRAAFRSHPGAVAVITADAGDGPVGLTATSVCSISADPPALAFSLSAISSAAPGILRAESVVVHLLDKDQLGLAQTFCTSGIDRFADTSTWDRLPTGEPYLVAAPLWMRGRITQTMDVGGSTVAAVQLLEISSPLAAGHERQPLVYCNRDWYQLELASS
jgi:flavin reductase (DIM6/NTAB) family NADH-FMN oxidoreductase RutF